MEVGYDIKVYFFKNSNGRDVKVNKASKAIFSHRTLSNFYREWRFEFIADEGNF